MTLRRTCSLALAALAATVLAGCGGDGDDAAAPADASPAVVTIERSRYEPDVLTVDAGTEVRFENLDPFGHTVTSAEGSPLAFDSGDMAQGDEFTQRFDDPGTYDYFCEVHPTMRSSVVVE